MHYKKKKDMPCTQCSHVSQSKGNLKIHIMLKHMKSHFRCKICNISFRRSPQLKDHVKKEHEMVTLEEIYAAMKCICMKCKYSSGFIEFQKHAEEVHHVPKKDKSQVNKTK